MTFEEKQLEHLAQKNLAELRDAMQYAVDTVATNIILRQKVKDLSQVIAGLVLTGGGHIDAEHWDKVRDSAEAIPHSRVLDESGVTIQLKNQLKGLK